MITDAVIAVFRGALTWLVSLLPTIAIPDVSGMVEQLGKFWELWAWANNFAPLDHLVTMLAIFVASWVAMQAVNGAVWALSKLHVLGGGSS